MTRAMNSALHASILAALLGIAACHVPNACDEGFTENHGVCLPDTPPAADAGGDGDGDEDAGDEADAAQTEPESEFICPAGGDSSVYGRACSSNDDCECPASVCLTQLGYCSGTQCLEPGKECPEGGTCLDIAPFRERSSFDVPDEVTHVCLQ